MRILFTFLILLFTAPANAEAPAAPATDIAAAENYLNTLQTAQARFVQTTYDGTQLVGTFYLSRPGKLRFEYDDPVEDFVVADGLFLYFYDAQLGEQSNIPIGASLADFVLRDNINLQKDVHVQNVQRGGDLLQITLVQKNDPDAGSLTLGFREDPFALKKWRVTDPQGLITEVELFYLEEDLELDKNLFIYRNPNKTPGQNFND